MNYQLAEAVIAIFRDNETEPNYDHLSGFDHRAWAKTYKWLDASGLALYFLDRIYVLHLETALPVRVLKRLQQNSADNEGKTARMFEEFVAVNREFKGAGISYSNLKGFTLVPDACQEATMRCQFDLDFIVAANDLSRCESVLERRGYALAGAAHGVKEFKTNHDQIPGLCDLYKGRPQRCIEIHFSDLDDRSSASSRDDQLSRCELRSWDGVELPILSDCDRFLGLALHLFKHLKSEWTRVSWILEYSRFIRFHRDDSALWLEVKRRTMQSGEVKIALGVTTLLANQSFGPFTMPTTLARAIEELPPPARLWVERYGDNVLFARFPGTKVYLFLLRAVSRNEREERQKIRRNLFPFHRPRKVLTGSTSGTSWPPLQHVGTEMNYLILRMWFHISQGLLYFIQAPRWNKAVFPSQL